MLLAWALLPVLLGVARATGGYFYYGGGPLDPMTLSVSTQSSGVFFYLDQLNVTSGSGAGCSPSITITDTSSTPSVSPLQICGFNASSGLVSAQVNGTLESASVSKPIFFPSTSISLSVSSASFGTFAVAYYTDDACGVPAATVATCRAMGCVHYCATPQYLTNQPYCYTVPKKSFEVLGTNEFLSLSPDRNDCPYVSQVSFRDMDLPDSNSTAMILFCILTGILTLPSLIFAVVANVTRCCPNQADPVRHKKDVDEMRVASYCLSLSSFLYILLLLILAVASYPWYSASASFEPTPNLPNVLTYMDLRTQVTCTQGRGVLSVIQCESATVGSSMSTLNGLLISWLFVTWTAAVTSSVWLVRRPASPYSGKAAILSLLVTVGSLIWLLCVYAQAASNYLNLSNRDNVQMFVQSGWVLLLLSTILYFFCLLHVLPYWKPYVEEALEAQNAAPLSSNAGDHAEGEHEAPTTAQDPKDSCEAITLLSQCPKCQAARMSDALFCHRCGNKY